MGDLFQDLIKGHIEQLEKTIINRQTRVEELEQNLETAKQHIRLLLATEMCGGMLYPGMIKKSAEDFLKRTEES